MYKFKERIKTEIDKLCIMMVFNINKIKKTIKNQRKGQFLYIQSIKQFNFSLFMCKQVFNIFFRNVNLETPITHLIKNYNIFFFQITS